VLAIAQAIWTQDPDGEISEQQPSWAGYTGQAFGEYRGRGWLDAVHPDDRASSVMVWSRAVASGAPYELEQRLRGRDGGYRYFSVRAVPVLPFLEADPSDRAVGDTPWLETDCSIVPHPVTARYL
jgi:PAS domain S-box-containing protein